MLFLVLLLSALAALYLYNRSHFKYWAKRGVKHSEPVIFFGNNARNCLMQQSRSEALAETYFQYPNERVVGFYSSSAPELILRGPNIIRKVLVSDFNCFYSRFHVNKHKIEPILKNTVFAEGDLWKMLRKTLSPAFTSGKLKASFPLVVDQTKILTKRIKKSKNPIDATELIARCTIHIIGKEFGLSVDIVNEEYTELQKLGKEGIDFKLKDVCLAILKGAFPLICMDLKYFSKLEKWAFSLVDKILKSRDYMPSSRNDCVDQLLAFKQKGRIEVDSIEHMLPDGSPQRVTFEFSEDLIAAQLFILYNGRVETTAVSTSVTLHQLAFNPDVQNKVQKEIDEVLLKHNNELSFDAVKEMTYLDWTFKESLRHFPPVGHLMRRSTCEYKFTDIDLTIDAGIKVWIPINALHMDPKYWDNPEEFRPERFHPDNLTPLQKLVYLPFGNGPRNCLGTRLGRIQSLAMLAAVLSRFTVEPAPGSKINFALETFPDIVQTPKGGGVPLIFRERKS